MKSITICCFAAILSTLALNAEAKQKGQSTNVKVTNNPANAVPVTIQGQVTTHNADDRTLFEEDNSLSPSSGDSGSVAFDVPAGKRLIIESITVYAAVPTGQNIWGVGMNTHKNGSVIGHTIVVTAQGTDNSGNARFAGTYPFHAFSDAGTGSVAIYFNRDSLSGSWAFGASISGYLVDVPTVTP